MITGHRIQWFAGRYSSVPALHLRLISHDARLPTESLSFASTAALAENQPALNQPTEKSLTEEAVALEEDSLMEDGETIQRAVGDNHEFAVDPVSTEPLEGAQESEEISPPGFYIQEAFFLSGRPWARQMVKPLRGYGPRRLVVIPGPEDELEGAEKVSQDMLHVVATTSSVENGWNAYCVLSRLQRRRDLAADNGNASALIPFACLHRLARLISQNVPKTRAQFLRLLSVLTTIQNYGGKIQLHEWNALIDHAGKGWRKSHAGDFSNSLSIYYDMVYNRSPGSRFSDADFDDVLSPRPEDDPFHIHLPSTPMMEPDIYTYTTLIDIAARTNHPQTLHRATILFKQTALPPNRITHLALLKYFTARKQLAGVRSTITKMQEQNLELGVDGLNACMWAYGHNKRVDVVMMIYRLLRNNIVPEAYSGADDITAVREKLQDLEGIIIKPDWRPNEVTFTLMIQTMAYYGNLRAALSVFIDMISTSNVERGAPLTLTESGELQPVLYSPTVHVFRALMLGFRRHGPGPRRKRRGPQPGGLEWNLENLQNIFDRFIELPPDTMVSEATVFWILNSFSRMGGHDIDLLRTVWIRMEDRFGMLQRGPNHRLTRWRRRLFPEAEDLDEPESGRDDNSDDL
ncbi:hypothetical protein Agabi119p4_4520 [Agaricus bisporus var. burnettii]|uniref:Pentacotripeptide-repeat region of PRORP domain-containing protein n=1 Tax=Agaricus bisporus var. burnettii TaxID=192524 RepID=A0A8H7F3K7_AGABI|nr:hypothetical protein Agabi119p4_4520 [Agaricus bisporus var. burnettii]